MRWRVCSPFLGDTAPLSEKTDRSVLLSGGRVPESREIPSGDMCGRYVQASSPALLASHFGVEEVRIEPGSDGYGEPSYNVTPRAEMPVVAVSKRDEGNVRV